jgi:hypothetical protein
MQKKSTENFYSKVPTLVADIVLHIMLVGSFVIIFFFFYASKIESSVVKNQTTQIINDLVEEVSMFLSEEDNAKLRTLFSKINPPDMTDIDNKVKLQNEALVKKTFYTMLAMLTIGVLIIALLWFFGKISLSSLLQQNAIALISIGLTDFVFLTFIASKYHPSDESQVKKIFLKNLFELN